MADDIKLNYLPKFKIDVTKILGDTTNLTCEEFGAYTRILFWIWKNKCQHIDWNNTELAAVAGVSAHKWRNMRDKIFKFFTEGEDQKFYQKRQQKSWDEAIQTVIKNRTNGKGGGRPKKGENSRSPKPTGFSRQNPPVSSGVKEFNTQTGRQTKANLESIESNSSEQSNTTARVSPQSVGRSFLEILGIGIDHFEGKGGHYGIVLDWMKAGYSEDQILTVAKQFQGRDFSGIQNPFAYLRSTILEKLKAGEGEDEPDVPVTSTQRDYDQWHARMVGFTERNMWFEHLYGPPPNDPNTKVPPQLLREFEIERAQA